MKESPVGSSAEGVKVDVDTVERLECAAKGDGLDQDAMGIWEQPEKPFV